MRKYIHCVRGIQSSKPKEAMASVIMLLQLHLAVSLCSLSAAAFFCASSTCSRPKYIMDTGTSN